MVGRNSTATVKLFNSLTWKILGYDAESWYKNVSNPFKFRKNIKYMYTIFIINTKYIRDNIF